MKPSFVFPVAKQFFVCDDVVAEGGSGKQHVVGLFNAVRISPSQFPYQLGKLCVFAEFGDGMGAVPFHVEILDSEEDRLLFRSQSRRLEFPDRNTYVKVVVRLLDCRFPRPGDYAVQLYCRGEFLDDRVIHLGELP